jgi:3-hydroxyisobutyrate dehydrogenase
VRTFGSVFTNPPGESAGRLLDQAGCRGLAVGGARFSPVHANFIEASPGCRAADVLARVEPILRHLGSKIVLQGGPGAGQHTKLCNQIVIASTMLGVCEGLAYAHSAGLDAQTVLSAIGGGAAGGFQLNNLGPRIAKGDFAPGFFIEHFIKDMRIAHEEAAHMGRELPGLNLVRSLYQKLAEEGFTRNGTQALFKLYER